MKLKERILSCITAAAITIVGQCAFSGYAPEAFAEEELISGFFLSDFDPEIPLEELPVWSMDKDHTVTIKGITDSLYLSLYSFQIFVPLDEEEFSEDTDPFYEDDPISRYMMSFAAYDHDTFGLPEKIIFEAEADNLDIPPQTLLDGAIKEIVYPDTIKKITIQHNAFEETDITDLTSCSELKAEMRSFENCKFLNSVKCTGNSTFIGKNTFSGCTSMKTAELNNASIEEEAFKNCYLLKNVKITGDSVISDGAFVNCRSLENVDFDIEFQSWYGTKL